MYKVLKIGNKEYKFEYSLEASLYDQGIESLLDFLGNTAGAVNMDKVTDGMNTVDKKEAVGAIMNKLKSTITNIPRTAITLFYMGLLEHHGEDGDGTVTSFGDAKRLAKQYYIDHAEDGTDTPVDLINLCLEQMGEDGFFKRTGLEKVFSGAQKTEESSATPNRAQRRAHKKASGK